LVRSGTLLYDLEDDVYVGGSAQFLDLTDVMMQTYQSALSNGQEFSPPNPLLILYLIWSQTPDKLHRK
jgi:hypothetical protein